MSGVAEKRKSLLQKAARGSNEGTLDQPAPKAKAAKKNSGNVPEAATPVDCVPPIGSRTQPYVTVCRGRHVPLVAEARLDGYGRLGLVAVFSDHLGLEALRSAARDFGIGRGAPATHEQIQNIVMNPSFLWAIPTVAVPDSDVPRGMQRDEVVLNQEKYPEDIAALLRAGVAVDVGRRCSTGFYKSLLVARVLFHKHAGPSPEAQVAEAGVTPATPSKKTQKLIIGDGSVSKPRGRVPSGKVWDSTKGTWVPIADAAAVAEPPSSEKREKSQEDGWREPPRANARADGPAGSQARPTLRHKFTVYEETARAWWKCSFCKQPLGGLCIKHEDQARSTRVLKREQATAKSIERYADARKQRMLAEMSPGEAHWYHYFEGYRNGAHENWDFDSDEGSESATADESGAEDAHRDFSVYLHLNCFARYKSKGWCKKNLTDPEFAKAVGSPDRDHVGRLFASLRGDGDTALRDIACQQRGVLTEAEFAQVQANQEALGKRTVPELRAMLEVNGQGGGNGKPKDVLVERIAEMQVLGALPKCPRCKGGRQGKGGNLAWSRATGDYTCSGYFGRSGPVKCNGPRADAVARQPWQEWR